MSIKPVHTVIAKDDVGPVDALEMLRQLEEGLSGVCGPFKTQPFSTKPGKYSTQVLAGNPGKAKSVYKLIQSLGFTGVYKSVTGYYGGARTEGDGKLTSVSYCNLSGVVMLTTQLR